MFNYIYHYNINKMYDTIWKVSVLAMLIYIIYSLYYIKKDIYIHKNDSKNIIQYKHFDNVDYTNDILTETDNSFEVSETNKEEDELSQITESSFTINIDNSQNENDLKNKNLKELKIIAKNLNIPIHNKKKNDIINEILVNK